MSTYDIMKKNHWKILLLILLWNLVLIECGFFSNAMDKIKNKAKAAYKKQFSKGKKMNFYGFEQSEYPGTNKAFRKENQLKWEAYYECLIRQNDNLGPQKTVTPEAILGFEGSFVMMLCKICLSPNELQNQSAISWEWASPNSPNLAPIDITEHILISQDDMSLRLYNLNNQQTGQYICHLGNWATAPYFLTIVNMSETSILEIRPNIAANSSRSQPAQEINNNLILDTEWGEWSSCNTCGKVGKKHRFGYCNVYLNTLIDKKQHAQQSNRTKRSIEVEELFQLFKYGIPCQSHILPPHIKTLPAIANRKNEIMTGYCMEKCPENVVFQIRDKHGKIIETANNTAGIYSLTQRLPSLEPSIERRTQYEIKGKDIVLECPGNINSDAPIQWQINDKNLIPEIILKGSHGRIFVSITDRIHIKNSKISDSNIYSCWQHKELAGTIRLVVEEIFELDFKHTIMLIGIAAVLGTFIYAFSKIVNTSKYVKI